MKINRFIVCGDSYSEGMCDEIIDGQYRGWADRVADALASESPDFEYANLAIRGKTMRQVAEEQLPYALSLVTGPETLVSFHAGANDAIRPGYDAAATKKLYQDSVRALAATGATVLLFTVLEDTGNTGKGAQIWKERFHDYNEAIWEVGREVGAVISDANHLDFFKDNRFLAFDRLHLNVEGHWRVSQGVLEVLGRPYDASWKNPLPPAPHINLFVRSLNNVKWFLGFGLPWIWRRIRGVSSGDGRQPKYPTPVKWPLQSK